MAKLADPFGARAKLTGDWGDVYYYRLDSVAAQLDRMPFTVRILLENVLRRCCEQAAAEDEVTALSRWERGSRAGREISFLPSRVLLQDFTGVPAVVDLAAMRTAVARLGGDPSCVNPLVPADLVIDHSVQVDAFGSILAFAKNVELEYARNKERYALLRWAQQAFANFRVVPPGMGIVHQVNLEHLATVVSIQRQDGEAIALPDTLVGTDSHTPMVNGLGVLGWGVGGIEAEAVLLGQPLYLSTPEVVGLRLTGELPEGATATDLVLTITQILRKHGVVNKFVEFTGPGLRQLRLPDRATISNMSPEFGATASLFPVDDETLRYLRETGRDEGTIKLVERYTKEQGLFRTEDALEPEFSEMLELELDKIEPSLAGPKRPQDRVPLADLRSSFRAAYQEQFASCMRVEERQNGQNAAADFEWEGGSASRVAAAGWEETADETVRELIQVKIGGVRLGLSHGAVVIAAITSCTNTSNPSVMIGAGLLAKKAVERGLSVKPYVKASLAPGSRAVTDYLRLAGLMPYLEALRFHLVGYGCTTCIGNSGPLPEPVASALQQGNVVAAAVLSGNRNFEGRIHPQVQAAYLASPALVIAYALAGTVDIDLSNEPLGTDPNGAPVYLRDIWPSAEEIRQAMDRAIEPEIFKATYARIMDGDERWCELPAPHGDLYTWDAASTYIQEPPFFQAIQLEPPPLVDIIGARALVVVGDSVTTDHISPAGAIPADSPAGRYLIERGVTPHDFNSYGSRRGNHEVMVRGTFGNIRLRNALVPDKRGDWTLHFPDRQEMRIYDAAVRYQAEGVPLLVLAGKEYGSGSSRDWAAKGPMLLGIRAILAESYERIHRSNLVGVGILPLEFKPGENQAKLGLRGDEMFDIVGISAGLRPGQELTVRAWRDDGGKIEFQAIARLDSNSEVEYYRNGGVLQMVLRQMLR